ncbi:hypothetical protein QOZ80_3AG0212240 [Eleusine coracana subsp. coracana]|nr:hypothetical protein QOZ80_3AG0212240 [Eleusine coracana subsp. coracana]
MAVAAHRNTILLRFAIATGTGLSRDREVHEEFFVFQVGPRSDSPPSLQRLPACRHVLVNRFGANAVGILCFGGDKQDKRGFMAAHLTVTPKEASTKRQNDCPVTAALCYICSLDGSLDGGWHTIKDLPILGAEGRGDDLLWWETDVVVSVGEYICWVDYLRGMLLCDVLSVKPKLHYVALPVDPYQGRQDPELGGRGAVSACRTLCVAKEEDGYVIRFVDVADNRCWFYGRPRRGYTSSPYSTISSWRLNSDIRTWKLDSMIEDDEFLTLTKRHNLPSTQLIFPLVDLNDPQTIYCAVRQEQCTFLMTVNMSTRTLVKTPYTFGSVETTGEGGRHKGKQPRNFDYTKPFLPCELICNEVSGGDDSYNNSNLLQATLV